jgi:hypothetical protein
MDTANSEKGVFALGDPNVTTRCPRTLRLFEVGSGALPHDQQTSAFVRQAALDGDMPRYESDHEARQRVRNEMQARGATADEIAAAVAKTVGGPEICSETGRTFECSVGCLTKKAQRALWAREANPTQAKVEAARTSAVETAAEVKQLAAVEETQLAAEEEAASASLANPFDPFVTDPVVIPTRH